MYLVAHFKLMGSRLILTLARLINFNSSSASFVKNAINRNETSAGIVFGEFTSSF
jgi:hypothetical protein